MTHLRLCVSLEDHFLTTLSSQSSTSSTHLQLPTPPEALAEQVVGGPTDLDSASGSEGTVWAKVYSTSLNLRQIIPCFMCVSEKEEHG